MLNYDETFSTLLFASRAMTVRVNPQINEEIFLKVKILRFLLKASRRIIL